MTEDKFYIGRRYDPEAGQTLGEPVLYDPADLTTHGVVVGMTGSGKTGLCVDILEEAGLQGIPAILVDPKGDIANLLLHFPDLAPEDFEPWVDPEEARREGKEPAALAAETAARWREGLQSWGIGPDRIARLLETVDYALYTPGSTAGRPISILSSLKAPPEGALDGEALRERVATTATALLGLVGVEADPLRSREHILLSNLLETAWVAGRDLDLAELIRQIQRPPFERLGAFELEQFFPAEERFELALLLNNLIASPTFQDWVEGDPLDVGSLLYTPEGRPRHSILYLAHLSEAERMFFVTLLLAAVEAWVRAQPGTSSLRALLYFDEVFGYLPPTANPPSKTPLLRLLKQARAFGFGLLLTTQNPVDLDYKALSNAGTWFVGRLQTEQDKARLLDGLETALADQGGFARGEVDRLLSRLGKRVFLLHNVHERGHQVFQTRWAMAYLRGPITRAQLGALVEKSVAPAAAAEPAAEEHVEAPAASATRPAVPRGVAEAFLPQNLTAAEALERAGVGGEGSEVLGILYRPALLAQASVRFLDRKLGVDSERRLAALVHEAARGGAVRWEDWLTEPVDPDRLDTSPAPEASYADLEPPLTDAKAVKALQKDFVDFVYHEAELRLPYNPTLDLVGEPGMTEGAFRRLASEKAREALEAESEKLREKYEKRIRRIEEKLAREERELAEDQADLSARKMEELASHAETVLGLFGVTRRRSVSSSLTKRRMTARAKADVEESEEAIEAFKAELAELEAELKQELEDLKARWEEVAAEREEKVLTPYKKNIRLEFFGLAWTPYWLVRRGQERLEIPAYAADG